MRGSRKGDEERKEGDEDRKEGSGGGTIYLLP